MWYRYVLTGYGWLNTGDFATGRKPIDTDDTRWVYYTENPNNTAIYLDT